MQQLIAGLPIGIALFAGALVAFTALALTFDGSGARRRLREQRLAAVAAMAGTATTTPTIRSRSRQAGSAWPPLLQKLLPVGPEFAERLSVAGVAMPAGRFWALFAATGTAAGVALLLFTGSRLLANSVGVAITFGGPWLAVAVLVAMRRAKFLLQFPDAIDLMIRSLRAGLPVDEAIAAVAGEGGDAVAPEFQRVKDRLAVGQSLEDSLWASARRLAIPDFDFFIVCLTVQRETGGKLTETLANLSDILRRRLHMRLKVQAMSAQARTSAGIIGSLPFLLCAALYATNPSYIGDLFADPRGRLIVAAGLVSEFVGIVVMIRMARFRI